MKDMIYIDLDKVYTAATEFEDINFEMAGWFVDWTIKGVKRKLGSSGAM